MSIGKSLIFIVMTLVITVVAELRLVTNSDWLYQAFAFSNIQSNIQGQNRCNTDQVQSSFSLSFSDDNDNNHNILADNSTRDCIVNATQK
jgi:hypothetical protein